MSVTLRRMTATEFELWRPGAVADYAEHHVRAGSMPADAAQAMAEKQFSDLLPDGTATPHHHLFVPELDGAPIGVLWLHRAEDGTVFIYDLAVDEAMRGRGLGRQVMEGAETQARELGATTMKLHVFGDNTVARRLYQSLGYRETNVMMAKSLVEPELDGS